MADNIRPGDVEIDLIDLTKSLVARWKSILVCGIICMIIVSGVHTLRSGVTDPEEALKTYKEELAEYDYSMRLYEQKESMAEALSDASEALTAKLNELDGLDPASEAWKDTVDDILEMDERIEKLESLTDGLSEPSEPVLKSSGGYSISIKFTVAGFVLGVLLMCGVWGTLYLMDGTIKTDDEARRAFGVRLLGAAVDSDLVAAKIANYMPSGTGRLLVTGTADETDIERITDAARSLGIDAIARGNVCGSAEAAGELRESDAVVLVETLKKSKLNDIYEEVELIEGAGKNLLGMSI